MACCCTRILDLCSVTPCDSGRVVTGMQVTTPGTYTLVLDYLGVDVKIPVELEEGEALDFPAENLNEKYKYTGKIIGPDGQAFPVISGEQEFDCISFQTRLSYQ